MLKCDIAMAFYDWRTHESESTEQQKKKPQKQKAIRRLVMSPFRNEAFAFISMCKLNGRQATENASGESPSPQRILRNTECLRLFFFLLLFLACLSSISIAQLLNSIKFRIEVMAHTENERAKKTVFLISS